VSDLTHVGAGALMTKDGNRRKWHLWGLAAVLILTIACLGIVRAREIGQRKQEAIWRNQREKIFCPWLQMGMSRDALEQVLDQIGPHQEDVSDLNTMYNLRVIFDDPGLADALGPAAVPFFTFSAEDRLLKAWYISGFDESDALCPSNFQPSPTGTP